MYKLYILLQNNITELIAVIVENYKCYFIDIGYEYLFDKFQALYDENNNYKIDNEAVKRKNPYLDEEKEDSYLENDDDDEENTYKENEEDKNSQKRFK